MQNLMSVFMPRGILWISSDGNDRRSFWGFEIFESGIFWVGKFCKYLFWWLDLSRDFLGYSKQSEDSWCTVVPTYPGRVVLRIK